MSETSVIDEQRRLQILRSYEILDTAPEDAFDNITSLAAEIWGVPIALISLVDEARQWFKARVGLDVEETPRELAFCAHALGTPEMLVVSDALADPRFAKNKLVTADPKIRFYAGVPIVSREGAVLGTLCVIDRVVRALDPNHVRLLHRLARQVEAELELRRRLSELRHWTSLPDESLEADSESTRSDASRDKPARAEKDRRLLVQLLVHDLKSPLMTISVDATLLCRAQWADARTRDIAAEIEGAAESMQRLIVSLLDIGRAERGALPLNLAAFELCVLLEEVVLAMSARAALKQQDLSFHERDTHVGALEIRADRELVRRVLENLLDNCLKYSPKRSQVRLSATRKETTVEVCVADEGPGIAEADRARIFQPFTRLELAEKDAPAGHGLGLAFCKLAIEAHGGRVWVTANQPKGSRFHLELPLRTNTARNG